MKKVINTSKKSGNITLSSETNHDTLFSKQLETRSLSQDEENESISQYSRLLGTSESIPHFPQRYS